MDHDGSFYTRGWLREKTERELLGEIRLYLLVITILVVSSACGVVIFGLSNLSNVNEIKQYVRDIKNMETLQPKQIDAMLANVFATVDNTRKISDMSVPTAARVFQVRYEGRETRSNKKFSLCVASGRRAGDG